MEAQCCLSSWALVSVLLFVALFLAAPFVCINCFDHKLFPHSHYGLLQCLTQWGMDLIRASCHSCGYNNPDGDTTTDSKIIVIIINYHQQQKPIIIIIMLFFLWPFTALAVKSSPSKLYKNSVKVLIKEVLRMYLFI